MTVRLLLIAIRHLWRYKWRNLLALLAVTGLISIVLILLVVEVPSSSPPAPLTAVLAEHLHTPAGILAGLALFMGAAATISLGGISVMERRSEISIRKVHGATRKHIFLQFLFEALIVTVIGSLMGLAGTLAGLALFVFITSPVVVTLFDVAVLTGVIVLASILVSLPPAVMAARQKPLSGLRH